jgi:hypothetical protein
MALVKIKSEDNTIDGVFDIALPIVITAVTSSTYQATVLIKDTIDGKDDMEIEIDTVPAAYTAQKFADEVEATVLAAIEAGIADPYVIPTISGITRLYDIATGDAVDNYLVAPTVTPIKAYDLV